MTATTELIERLLTDADEIEACGGGNEAATMREAAAALYLLRNERDNARDGAHEAETRARALEVRLATAERERDALIEALTASGDTKAAYIGEFKFDVAIWDHEAGEDGDGAEIMQRTFVPWTTVKEIMAAIRARALITKDQSP